jgi:hypothetical protein
MRAQKLADQIAEVHARYQRELAPLEHASEDIKAEWSQLRSALPRAVISTLRLEMAGLDVPALEAGVGLAKFDARDPSPPAWLAPVIEQSRALAERSNPPMPINVPVAP